MSELSLHRGISFQRIGAMILRYWYLLLSSWPRLLELMYWPILHVIVSGLVLRNGLGAESIVWTLMFGLLPLACVYYPVKVLPLWLQPVAWCLPPTYVFEGLRALLTDHVFRADLMLWALVINVALLVASFG